MTGYRSIISTLLETPGPQSIAADVSTTEAPVEPEASRPAQQEPVPPAKEANMPINTDSDDYKAGAAASAEATRKAERDRFTAVMGSEHYAGREKLAATLLKSDMSAADIVAALGDAPKAEPSAPNALSEEQQLGAAEAAGREEMLKAIAETGNSHIDANGGGKGNDKKADASTVWDKAHARVYRGQVK